MTAPSAVLGEPIPAPRRRRAPRTLAVALHDVEPATYERCALIRDWLSDHGVDRVTLLVIPARDLHPFHDRRPEMTEWLAERSRAGDSVAQHGLSHVQLRPGPRVREALGHRRTARTAEFVGLDEGETQRAVSAGRRLLKLAGIEPRGFVAPAYAYTPALRVTLREQFEWWAGLWGLHRGPAVPRLLASRPAASSETGGGGAPALPRLSPAFGFGQGGAAGRALSPLLVRAGACSAGSTLRLDLHPSDLDRPGHVLALEWALRRARRRTAVTYDDLAG